MNWKRLSHLSQNRIKQLQNKKLRDFIRYQIPYSPYYKALFKKNKIRFNDIRTTDDLVKVPFTTKADIAPVPKDPKKPRNFILQPNKELLKQYAPKGVLLKALFTKKALEHEYKPVHMHFTAGRTAAPVPFLYSNRDIELLKETGLRMMDVFGISKDEKVINAFPYSPHLAFWQAFYACSAAKLTSLQTGGGRILGTKKIIDAVESMKANTVIAMPGYAYHVIKTAAEKRKNFSSVKHIILGGERVSPGLRDNLKELLHKMGSKNPKILSTYALTEGKAAWPQCSEKSSYHIYPDMEFIEVVDKNRDRVAEGERGEIVYSALDWRGTVVLRYKTGDVASIEYGKCPYCGRTVPRISIDIERKSEFKRFDFFKVKGTLVNLNIFFPLLSGHKSVDEWQIELRKRNNDPYEVDEMLVYIAPKKGVKFEQLSKDLKEKIREQTDVTPKIVKTGINKLLKKLGMETELKEKRVVDKRVKL